MPSLPALFRPRPPRLSAVVRRWPRRSAITASTVREGPPPPSRELITFLRDLGVALVRSGEATSQIAGELNKLARAYRAETMQFFVLPTGVFVRIRPDQDAAVDFASASGRALRLDQVGALRDLVREAESGQLPPTEGSDRLAKILAIKPRFSVPLILLAQILQTLGLGLIRNPAPRAVIGLAILALLVGLLRLLAQRFPVLFPALPVAAGILVTVVALSLPKEMTGGDPGQLLIPPLITFLPGAALTIGTIELATNALISGAARLMYSFNALFMLAFGILVGSQLTGTVIAGQASQSIGLWAPLIGVVLLGVGFFIDSSGPATTLPWLLAALYAVWLVQLIGNQSGSGLLGAFLGGLALTPVAAVIDRQRTGPPAQVVFLPSFWLLVPGSSSLAGLSELISGSSSGTGAAAGLASLLTALINVLAIALGVLVASGLAQSLFSDHAP
jgi:uncharacterized membrane protein YjjP (DUF1212 family)